MRTSLHRYSIGNPLLLDQLEIYRLCWTNLRSTLSSSSHLFWSSSHHYCMDWNTLFHDRNGFCSTGDNDIGRHTVCVQVTDDFLSYSKSVGNDLSTPMPEYHFPGLKEGDIWCLCAQRWAQVCRSKSIDHYFIA